MGKLKSRRKPAERDMLASAKQHSRHLARHRAYISGVMAAMQMTLIEDLMEIGTRVHAEDAREIVALVQEFHMELNGIFGSMRVVQDGKRDHALSAPADADLSNVISFRAAAEVQL